MSVSRSGVPSPLAKPLWHSQFIEGLRAIRPQWSEHELAQVAERWAGPAGVLPPSVALALFVDMKRAGGDVAVGPPRA